MNTIAGEGGSNTWLWLLGIGALLYIAVKDDKKGVAKIAASGKATGKRLGIAGHEAMKFYAGRNVTVKDAYGTMRGKILKDPAPPGQVRIQDSEGNRYYVYKNTIR
jgi:hypothetical protein